MSTSVFPQWPHPADGDRHQPGCGSGAQDPSQVRRQRVCQREYLCTAFAIRLL